MNSQKKYQTPLRYPGGKQKDIPFLFKFFKQCQEFREPFLGGGSILLNSIKRGLATQYYANDLNPLVFSFWKEVQNNAEELADFVWKFHKQHPYRGPSRNSPAWQKFRQHLTNDLNDPDKFPDDQFHRAARFFILNRSTSGGSTESGGMTAAAYCDRFTRSSVERLRNLHGLLDSVQLSNVDYSELIARPGQDVFIFLDPPYLSAEKSGLYGKSGDLHRGFDHEHLARVLYESPHRWLMTIDDCPEVRELYNWREIRTLAWKKSYGMTNTGGRQSKRGHELLIANFPLDNDIFNLDHFPKSVVKQINLSELKIHPLYEDIYGKPDKNNQSVIYYRNKIKETANLNSIQDDEPIDINEQNMIIDGHARYISYLIQGIEEVSIRIRFCSEETEKAFILNHKRNQERNNFQKAKEVLVWKNELLEYLDAQIQKHPEYHDAMMNISKFQHGRIHSRQIAYKLVFRKGNNSGPLVRVMKNIETLKKANNLNDFKIAQDVIEKLQKNIAYTTVKKHLQQAGKYDSTPLESPKHRLFHNLKPLYLLMEKLDIF
ncbi:DNA adenine methylase [Spirulina major CS-329]|uniref:DNA adenine methylase n=1 Tax=Spirulina TaxID=1154 RepID=UPI00232FF3CA|nr:MULTISPECIES: DNA adenine methylase [Spirulina]MDB9496140.1 DNA adenine methylase [Spirulina subsalsa CS-330]MDB9502758.1 DNA adenine methylase [Spirulina major CS-329]